MTEPQFIRFTPADTLDIDQVFSSDILRGYIFSACAAAQG